VSITWESPWMSCFAIVARSIAIIIACRTFCLVSGLSAPVRPAASMVMKFTRMMPKRSACRVGTRAILSY
jgi:hypothetical protein